jgi:hypothetical protein
MRFDLMPLGLIPLAATILRGSRTGQSDGASADQLACYVLSEMIGHIWNCTPRTKVQAPGLKFALVTNLRAGQSGFGFQRPIIRRCVVRCDELRGRAVASELT